MTDILGGCRPVPRWGAGVGARISVSLKGPMGLDDPARLISELEAKTGLAWYEESAGDAKTLSGGLVEILLVAVASKTTEMAYEAAVERAKQVVDRFRAERLDPPQATVQVENTPEADADGSDLDASDD